SPAQAIGDVVRTINVSGEGRASSAPDIAMLNLGVGARGATVREALAGANQAMGRLVASLRADGIADRDIQTTSFSVSPIFGQSRGPEGGPAPIVGYQANQFVRAKVRALDTVGPVIDDAAAATGDAFQIQGLQFGIDDPT